MKRLLIYSSVLFILLSAGRWAIAQKQPNILIILSDDAGYADFGFQGSNEFLTPNLDRLAQQGLVFEQAYVTAAVCGPSRAGMLTGRYQQRFGYEENNVPGYMDNNACLSDDDMGLPLDQKTIGNYMKDLGYATGYFGKWHMGNANRFHPTHRGFDVFHGFRGGARSYYDYNSENPNYRHEDWLEHGYGQYAESEKYLTHELADQTIAFIEANKSRAFFAFLSFNAVHTPMEPEDALLDAFSHLSGKRQKLAAMTLSMDRACGKVLDKLKELGLDDNTIVIYTNDNGGPSDTNASLNKPLSGTKANHLEGGIRVPFIIKWPGVVTPNSKYKQPISTLDILPTCVEAAGGESNSIVNLDGVNLKPFLMEEDKNRPHQTLYWKKENRAAIRHGDWKLLRFPDRPAELYKISDDEAEVNNRAMEQPEKVKELYKMLFEWECTLTRPKWMLKQWSEWMLTDNN